MNPDLFVQSTILVVNDDFIKNAIFFHNGAKWKADRSAMTHQFTSAKLKGLLPHFKSVTDQLLSIVDELNEQTGNRAINVKQPFKCWGIDCIAKFIFGIDTNTFKDE